jgi:hypothetical protein
MLKIGEGINDEKNVYWKIHRHLDANRSTQSWAQLVNYEALKAIVFLHKPTVNNDNCTGCNELYPCKTIALIRSSINA